MPLECTFCGREVKPTVHRRETKPLYEVDYYIILSGELEKVTMQNPLDESETIEFHKMVKPIWVVACADCCQDENKRARMDEMFSGLPERKGD